MSASSTVTYPFPQSNSGISSSTLVSTHLESTSSSSSRAHTSSMISTIVHPISTKISLWDSIKADTLNTIGSFLDGQTFTQWENVCKRTLKTSTDKVWEQLCVKEHYDYKWRDCVITPKNSKDLPRYNYKASYVLSKFFENLSFRVIDKCNIDRMQHWIATCPQFGYVLKRSIPGSKQPRIPNTSSENQIRASILAESDKSQKDQYGGTLLLRWLLKSLEKGKYVNLGLKRCVQLIDTHKITYISLLTHRFVSSAKEAEKEVLAIKSCKQQDFRALDQLLDSVFPNTNKYNKLVNKYSNNGRDSDFAPILYDLSLRLGETNYEESKRLLTKAIEKYKKGNPGQVPVAVIRRLAYIYLKLGQHEKAGSWYYSTIVTDLSPQSSSERLVSGRRGYDTVSALQEFATVKFHLKKDNDASTLCNRAIELCKEQYKNCIPFDILISFARLKALLEDYESANMLYEAAKVLEIDRNKIPAEMLLDVALVKFNLGKYAESAYCYRYARASYGAVLPYNMIRLQLQLKYLKYDKDALTEADVFQESACYKYKAARYEEAAEDYDKALALYRHYASLDQDPTSPTICFSFHHDYEIPSDPLLPYRPIQSAEDAHKLARFHYSHSQTEAANDMYDRAFVSYESQVPMTFLLDIARFKFHLRRYGVAESLYRRAEARQDKTSKDANEIAFFLTRIQKMNSFKPIQTP